MSASNNNSFMFDDRVAVITGAGRGIGRAHALAFARRGAKVVVNDFGTSVEGEQQAGFSSAADKVVAEIRELGGEAVANYASVEAGHEIIEQALEDYGQVDVLVNNAGIMTAIPFAEMTFEQWRKMHGVHVDGAFACTRAAWKHMQASNYGRIILTASPAMYGSAMLAHYAAAKSAMVGFAGSLAQEGASCNILCNAIVPTAASRMVTGALPDEFVAQLNIDPDNIAQLAVWLCHEASQESGYVYEVGGGFVGKIRYAHSKGANIGAENFSAELIAANMRDVDDFSHPVLPENSMEATARAGLDLGGINPLAE